MSEARKQVSFFVPLSDWLLLRHAAAKRSVPMTRLVLDWIEPELERLRTDESENEEQPSSETNS